MSNAPRDGGRRPVAADLKQERSVEYLGDRGNADTQVNLEFVTQWDSGRKCYRSNVGWEVLSNGGRTRSYSWIFPPAVPFTHTEQFARYSRNALATAHQAAQTMLTELATANPEAFQDLFELSYDAVEMRRREAGLTA